MRIASDPPSRIAARNREPSARELFMMMERLLKRCLCSLQYQSADELRADITNVLLIADKLRDQHLPARKRIRSPKGGRPLSEAAEVPLLEVEE